MKRKKTNNTSVIYLSRCYLHWRRCKFFNEGSTNLSSPDLLELKSYREMLVIKQPIALLVSDTHRNTTNLCKLIKCVRGAAHSRSSAELIRQINSKVDRRLPARDFGITSLVHYRHLFRFRLITIGCNPSDCKDNISRLSILLDGS
jgi:hypothetical protein